MFPTELFDDILSFSDRSVLDATQLSSKRCDALIHQRFSCRNLRLLEANIGYEPYQVALRDPKKGRETVVNLGKLAASLYGSRIAQLSMHDTEMTEEALEQLMKQRSVLKTTKFIAPIYYISREVFEAAFTSLFSFESVQFFGTNAKGTNYLATTEFFEMPSIQQCNEISFGSLRGCDVAIGAIAEWLSSCSSTKAKTLSISEDSELDARYAQPLVDALIENFNASKAIASFTLKIRYIADDEREPSTEVYYNKSTDEELSVSSFIENPEETPMYIQIRVERRQKGASIAQAGPAKPAVNLNVLLAPALALFVICLLSYLFVSVLKG